MRYFFGIILALLFFVIATAFAANSIIFKQVATADFVYTIIDTIPFETLKENAWNENVRPAFITLKIPAKTQEQIKIIVFTELLPTEDIKKQLKQNVAVIFTWLNSTAPADQLKLEVGITTAKLTLSKRILPLANELGLPQQLVDSYAKTITQLPDRLDIVSYLKFNQKQTEQLLQAQTIYRTGNTVVTVLGVLMVMIVLTQILLFRKRLKIALRFLAIPLLISAIPLLFFGATLQRVLAAGLNKTTTESWFGIQPIALLTEQIMKVSIITLWWFGAYVIVAAVVYALSFAFKRQKEYTNEAQTLY